MHNNAMETKPWEEWGTMVGSPGSGMVCGLGALGIVRCGFAKIRKKETHGLHGFLCFHGALLLVLVVAPAAYLCGMVLMGTRRKGGHQQRGLDDRRDADWQSGVARDFKETIKVETMYLQERFR